MQIGNRLRVLPGETIPVDGVNLSGSTAINQAIMTGESLPVDKTMGGLRGLRHREPVRCL